jgi:hypothetical protein
MAKTELDLGSRDTGKDAWLGLAIKQISGACARTATACSCPSWCGTNSIFSRIPIPTKRRADLRSCS